MREEAAMETAAPNPQQLSHWCKPVLLYFLGVFGASKSQRVWGRQSLRDLRGSQWDQERLRESGEELRGAEMMGVRSD